MPFIKKSKAPKRQGHLRYSGMRNCREDELSHGIFQCLARIKCEDVPVFAAGFLRVSRRDKAYAIEDERGAE